jgi:hypothetical protein
MGTSYEVSSSDNLAKKLWSERLYQDTVHNKDLSGMLVSEGVVVVESNLVKQGGDRVRKNWSTRISNKGIIGDAPVRPNAVSVNYVTDDIIVDKLTLATKAKTKGSMAQQRTAFDLQDSVYEESKNWYIQRANTGMTFQLGGYNAATITYDGITYTGDERLEMTGLQIPTAPTTYRKQFAVTTDTADTDVASDATMNLQAIDRCVTAARTQNSGANNFKPLMGKEYQFLLLLGSTGFQQLIQQAQSNGNLTVSQMILNQLAGGKRDAFNVGNSFLYNGTKVVEVSDHYIPFGLNSTTPISTVKRALFLGAEAGCLAFGKGFDGSGDPVAGFNFVEEEDKIENEIIIKVESIMGIKKAVVNSYDQSVMTLSYYSA